MSPSRGTPIAGPTAVFLAGEPSPEQDRVTDAILDLRPGVLLVLAAA